MKLRFDTHIVLWALDDDPKLTSAIRTAMVEAESLHGSAVSIWQIAVKRALGKLEAHDDLIDVIRRLGVLPLTVSWAHGAAAGALPPRHTDPFDRLLIAQARVRGADLGDG